MEIYKDRSSLVFKKDSNNTLRYDFKDSRFYKITNGRKERKIKYPQSFFTRMNFHRIIESCTDDKSRKFLRIIFNNTQCYNVGSIVNLMQYYTILEPWISQGFNVSIGCKINIKEVPKDILRIIKELDIDLRYSDKINRLKEKSFIDCVRYLYNKDKDKLKYFIGKYKTSFNNLVTIYNYNYRNLIDYIFYIKEREGYDPWDICREIQDYARMQNSMNNKFNKYPKYFRTVHDITVVNYNVFKKEYSEELFQKNINTELEYEGKKFSITIPTTTEEIKNEGVALHHCVASYIDNVSEGKTNIVFLRKTKELSKSLITVEVRDNILIQASGEYNRSMDKEEILFLIKYCKEKKITNNRYKGE